MSLPPRHQKKSINKVVRTLDSSPIQLKGRGYNDWTLATKTLRCQGMKLHVEYDHGVHAPTRIELSHANTDDCRTGQSWPIVSVLFTYLIKDITILTGGGASRVKGLFLSHA